MRRVGQNHINAPYMTVNLVVSLPKSPYIHRIYVLGGFSANMTVYMYLMVSLPKLP